MKVPPNRYIIIALLAIILAVMAMPDTAFSLQVNALDTTPPTITYTRMPAPNDNGWNNCPVTIRFLATDAGSGIRGMATYSRIIATEGFGQSVAWSATDNAGNAASVTVSGINIDTYPPAVLSTSPASRDTDVPVDTPITITFDDSLDQASVVAGLTLWDGDHQVATTVSRDSADTVSLAHGRLIGGKTYTVRVDGVQDLAGNPQDAPYTWTFTTAQSSDTTAPAITYTRLPAANANGWNNDTVTVVFTASDTESGLATADSYTKVFSTDGAGQSVTWSATDNTGNTRTVTVDNVNIDTVAPAIAGAPTAAANANGWYNTSVVVHFTATDTGGSGIASVTPDVSLATEGSGLSAAGVATDRAGNMARATVGDINIDLTAPAVTSTVPDSGIAIGSATTAFDGSTPVSAVFSEQIDAASAIAGLTLWDGGRKVPGTVTYDSASRVALLAHTALAAGKTYTARVEGVKDLAGNAMNAAYVWSFSVAAPTPAPVRDAAIVSNFGTNTMTAGNYKLLVVTVKNTGTASWSAREGYALSGLADAGRFGSKKIPLLECCAVKPGKLQTFFIVVKAPEQAGKYTLQYQMSFKGAGFGETLTMDVLVTEKTVKTGCPRWSCDLASNPCTGRLLRLKW